MEAKKARELTKIINICKKLGVIELKFDGFEVKLSPSAILQESKYKQKKAETLPDVGSTPLTDEELLFWSSSGLPEGSI